MRDSPGSRNFGAAPQLTGRTDKCARIDRPLRTRRRALAAETPLHGTNTRQDQPVHGAVSWAVESTTVADERVDHRSPQPSSPMRVLIGNDDPLYLAGIDEALRLSGAEVVARVAVVRDVARKTRAHTPDLVVFDLEMARLLSAENQIEELRDLRALESGPAILVLSRLPDAHVALSVLGDKPAGYGFLVKRSIENLTEFTGLAWRVACGGTTIDPLVLSRLAEHSAGPLPDLTGREREVLSLIAAGRSNTFIAGELVVTVAAVERHVTNIFLKLNLRPNASDHRRVLAAIQYLDGLAASEDGAYA